MERKGKRKKKEIDIKKRKKDFERFLRVESKMYDIFPEKKMPAYTEYTHTHLATRVFRENPRAGQLNLSYIRKYMRK